jgi:hypothetical protein
MDASRNVVQKKGPRTAMSGRKPAQESRATEFRRKLMQWKQTPESSRPSLRALARELDTSHQLLAFYLKGLGKWRAEEYWRQAREIRARAMDEDRDVTSWEEQQARAYDRAGAGTMAHFILLESIERMKKESEQRLLCRQEIKALKMFARDFPEAQELLQKCLRDGVMKRKPFEEIVKDTPRQKGETFSSWVGRIWDECEKYDTKIPHVITEELLEEYSQGSAENPKNNLPLSSSRVAKSFRREGASLATPLNVEGGRGDTCRRMNPQ